MHLNFFTAAFPYKNSEPFIQNEIDILCRQFSTVTLFAHYSTSELITKKIPANCSVITLPQNFNARLKISDYFLIIKIVGSEFFLCKKKKFFLTNLKTWLSLSKKAVITSNWLQTNKHYKQNSISYSYWLNDWALVLTAIKIKNKNANFIFRCLGFDIWDERHSGNYLPFRGIIYKYTNGIYPNSFIAETYLKEKKIFAHKIKHAYLGTLDYGIGPFDSNKKFTLVSCSNVIPLKRIELIIEILAHVQTKIRWIHIGIGSELEKIKSLVSKINDTHEIEFKGYLTTEEYQRFFLETSINLIINVSSSEGLPVTLQEAISFGIPCISTNVGGVNEVVNEETGILISENFDPKIVAEQIESFNNSDKNQMSFRKKVRQFWLDNFHAEKVFGEFVQEIKKQS